MSAIPDRLRDACRAVAALARSVEIVSEAIEPYAGSLPLGSGLGTGPDPAAHVVSGSAELRAAFWLTLDAVNFGSGWFPTLRKPDGRSGYFTIATALKRRFESAGAWSAGELGAVKAEEVAHWLGQDRHHELMALFARSLRDLGSHVEAEAGGRFESIAHDAGGSAVALVERLAGWECFGDVSCYGEISVPFVKRAQLLAADLHAAGLARFSDLHRLTMFADNLVPHVLRLDGVLRFDPGLEERIERGELLAHGSTVEVEIRACAVHAVELIVAATPGSSPAAVDNLLWHRGQQPRYKARPRHRARCTAY